MKKSKFTESQIVAILKEGGGVKMRKKSILIMLFLFIQFCSNLSAQTNELLPWEPKYVFKGMNCEENYVAIGTLSAQTDFKETYKDNLIIIISHLGKKETKSNLGKRRLYNAKIMLLKQVGEVSAESVVTAEGENVEGNGYLDIFAQGELEMRIFIRQDSDFLAPFCVSIPPEKPCGTTEEKLYYPCKKDEGN